MTPQRMAQIHAASFTKPRPWTASEFTDLIAKNHIQEIHRENGFAVLSIAGGEAELLTLAVDPDHRNQGIARDICAELETICKDAGVTDIFLEVSIENPQASRLYESLGFKQTGVRKDYYLGANGISVSATVMKKSL